LDIVESLPEGVAALFAKYQYLMLLFLFLISEAGVPLPFPNHLLVLYAAYLAGQGQGNAFLILLSTVLGIVLGAWLLYWLALRGGKPLLLRYGKYIKLQPEKLARVEEWFEKRGSLAIIVGRLTPGLRIQTAIVAGLFNVPRHVFLGSTALSALIWTCFYLLVGVLLENGYEIVASYLSPGYQLVFVAFILFAVAIGFVVFRTRRGRV